MANECFRVFQGVDPAFDSGVDEFIQNAAKTGRVTVEDLDPFSHPFVPHLTMMFERKPYTRMRQQPKKTGAIFLDPPPPLPPETRDVLVFGSDWDQLRMTWREWFYGQ